MTYLTLERHDDVAVIWFDDPDRPVNTISPDVLDELDEVLDVVERDDSLRAAVFASRKANSFIVGADVKVLRAMNSPEEVEALSRRAHEMIRRVRSSKKPTVAAMHGTTMGGGLEMALACSYRVASNSGSTKFALPEVKLGLLPGGGGTQLLPRLIGIQQALPMMLTGKNVYPRKGRRIGLVDVVTHEPGLLHAAISAARELADGSLRPDRTAPRSKPERLLESNTIGRRIIYRKAKDQVDHNTKGNYPAPYRMLEAVKAGFEEGLAAGFDAEARAFGELAFTPEARQLMFLFFAKQRAEKNPYAELLDDHPQRVAVLGAGLMGAGIAEVTVTGDYDVILKDMDLEHAAPGKKIIYDDLSKKVRKGAYSEFERDQYVERVLPTGDYDEFEHVDLVIEAVPENVELKHQVIADTEAATKDSCVFASNTSSIPITRLAEGSSRKDRFLGMHYFSPVPKMPLLEIIKTDATSDEALAVAYAVGLDQGKTIITVNDGPGFYTTRILAIYMNEALELLEEGADILQVDGVMKRFGFPMGPYELFDLVGIEVADKITDVLGPFFQEQRGLRSNESAGRLVEKGWIGQKSGRGFFEYEDGKRGDLNEAVYGLFGGPKRKSISDESIRERMSLAMVNEAIYCLDEGILETAEDGDVGAVFGLGFPPFLGGPFRYVDREGSPAIFARLGRLANDIGPRFAPAPLLKKMAQAGARFYEKE